MNRILGKWRDQQGITVVLVAGITVMFMAFAAFDLLMRMPLLISMPETLKSRFNVQVADEPAASKQPAEAQEFVFPQRSAQRPW